MPYQATVYNVMIASPGDVSVERNIVRDVVHEWNTIHSSTRKTVLLPIGWETHSTPLMGDRPQSIINRQVLQNSDLLIATFWTRIGTPTGKEASGTVEEIEEHIKARKPALIYFSAVPVALDSVDSDQYRALKEFKENCKTRGLLNSYSSTAEFHENVRRHVAQILNEHSYFENGEQPGNDGDTTASLTNLGVPIISREAQELLLEATSSDGIVMVIDVMTGSTVQANQRNFVEPDNPRSRAMWKGAVDELCQFELLERVGYKGEMFRATRRGYEVADLLRP